MVPAATQRPTRPSALEDLRTLAPWPQYLRQVWDRRWFVLRVPVEELRAENATTSLGSLWHLLNPLLFLAVYYMLFFVQLRAGGGIEHYLTYLSVGIFFFRYCEQSAHRGGRSLVGNMPLVLSVRFPRLILPMSGVVIAMLYLLLGFIALVVIALLDGAYPRATWLYIIPILVLQTMFNIGLASFLARAVFHLHDIENLTQHLFRVLFYASGVLFPVEAFVSGTWLVVFTLNPFFAFVAAYRWAFLGVAAPNGTLISILVWSFGAMLAGIWYFRRAELRYGRQEF